MGVMKGRWYVNWLVVITMVLLFTSVGIFGISIYNSYGIKKCAYGDDIGENCICDSKGEVVCEEEVAQSVVSTEFTGNGLSYSYDFLSYFDVNSSDKKVKFVNVSQLNGGLQVTVELATYCNQESTPARQVGFFKMEEDRLIFTTVSSLVDEAFNRECIVEGTFTVKEFNVQLSDTFEIVYQDEYGSLYPANNCVYQEYLRNNGDVYNSADGCSICRCLEGENVCEKQDSCL
jgi:hypothetical protein